MTSRIGALCHRLALEAPVSTPDGAGGSHVAWAPLVTVWAALHPATGDEREAGDGLAGRVTHEIVIRYRGGITPDMRFRNEARVFDIRAVIDPSERRFWLRCLCEEQVQ